MCGKWEGKKRMDQITIKELEVFAHHGVYPEETKLGQKFLVSCVLHLDAQKAGRMDDLNQSVDYGAVARLLAKQMERNTYRLLEAAAEHLAETLLLFDDKIRCVDLEIQKPWAPIGLPVNTVSVTVHRKWHEAFLALGSNMGDRRAYIENAWEALGKRQDCRIKKISGLIETEAYGGVEQDKFLNGALRMDTLLTPYGLLDCLHGLEQQAGRERKVHWGPRTLDLDILFYDDLIMGEDDLCIPHADMHNRAFVLKPMAEIAPYKRHPVYGRTMVELLKHLT